MRYKQQFIKEVIGVGAPHVALVACLHGDEIIGLRVFDALKKEAKKLKGALALIVAHPHAIAKKKRFVRQDLNRSFPGRQSGNLEEQIAHSLLKELRAYSVVIDIHATNSNIDELAIFTKKNTKVKNLLKALPTRKAAFIDKHVFGGNELITHVPCGVSLEYGPDKSGKNYKKALHDIQDFLIARGTMKGSLVLGGAKKCFEVFDIFRVPSGFKQSSQLQDFHLIHKGDVVGWYRKLPVLSPVDFYPLFLGKGRYQKTLALMARQVKI